MNSVIAIYSSVFVENRYDLPTKGKIFIRLIHSSLLVLVAALDHMKVGQKHWQCIFLPQGADYHCLFTVFECCQIDACFFILRGSPSIQPLQTVNAEPVLEMPVSPQIRSFEHPKATVFLEYFFSLP